MFYNIFSDRLLWANVEDGSCVASPIHLFDISLESSGDASFNRFLPPLAPGFPLTTKFHLPIPRGRGKHHVSLGVNFDNVNIFLLSSWTRRNSASATIRRASPFRRARGLKCQRTWVRENDTEAQKKLPGAFDSKGRLGFLDLFCSLWLYSVESTDQHCWSVICTFFWGGRDMTIRNWPCCHIHN